MIPTKSFQSLSLISLGLALLLGAPDFTRAQNQVMGELKFSGPTKIKGRQEDHALAGPA